MCSPTCAGLGGWRKRDAAKLAPATHRTSWRDTTKSGSTDESPGLRRGGGRPGGRPNRAVPTRALTPSEATGRDQVGQRQREPGSLEEGRNSTKPAQTPPKALAPTEGRGEARPSRAVPTKALAHREAKGRDQVGRRQREPWSLGGGRSSTKPAQTPPKALAPTEGRR